MKDPKEFEKVETIAKRDAKRDARRDLKYSGAKPLFFEDANEPVKCWAVIRELGRAIDCMYMMSDGYYREYIWNAGGETAEQLKKNGLDRDEFYLDIAGKLEVLRSILFGHNADWDALETEIYDNLLLYEYGRHKTFEEMFDRVLHQKEGLQAHIRKMEEEAGTKKDENS